MIRPIRQSILILMPLILLTLHTHAVQLIPQPREIQWGSTQISFNHPVAVLSENNDPRVERALNQVLQQHQITTTTDLSRAQAIIVLGTEACQQWSPEIVEQSKILPREGYRLEIQVVDRKPVFLLAGADEAGTFYAVQTLRQLLADGNNLRTVFIRDYPGFTEERGYGEFFYGEPWTHQERLAALEFMGQLKMNFYMYSPKDDPYHRDRWREDYPPEEMQRMKELIEKAEENFITFSFAVNPGLSMKYSDEEDFRILVRKFDQMIDLGVRNCSLQLDDIGNAILHEEDSIHFQSQGEAHAYMFNKVYRYLKERNPDIGYSICGMMYYIAEPDDYTRTLGEMVYPEIPIMWTGSEVVDPEITIDEVYLYASGIRRKPFISDNYPVNDFATNRLFMGPLTGRSNDLIYHVYPGFLQNPMNQEEASRIALGTIADYAWNPMDYEPERSWNHSIRFVVGEKGYAAMRLFCESNRSSVMEKRESIELNELIQAWFDAPSRSTQEALEKYLSRMANLKADLNATVSSRKLLQEIAPWVHKLELYGKAGLLALEIQSAAGDASIERLWSRWHQLNRMMEELRQLPQEVSGGVMERLIYRTTVGGAGLGIQPVTPSATYDRRKDFILNPSGSYTLDLMVDNNNDTWFRGDRGLEVNDFIQVTYPRIRPVQEIRAHLSTPDQPVNFIYYGELQYTTNLRTWRPLGRVIYPEVKWLSDEPVAMRAARILVTEPQRFAPVVREFKITPADRPHLYGTFAGLTQDNLEFIRDGVVSTVFRTEEPLQAGQFIQLSFGDQLMPVETVTLLMGEKEHLRNAMIELTADGSLWQRITPVRSSAVRAKIPGGKAIAVRVILTANHQTPLTIHEFSLADSGGNPY